MVDCLINVVADVIVGVDVDVVVGGAAAVDVVVVDIVMLLSIC